MLKKLKRTETCFSSYFSYNYFKQIWQKEISVSLSIYTILCWSSDAPPPSVMQKFKFLASSIVQESSSTRRDAVCVCLQLDTYIAEVQAGGTLNVNAFEFWHARGPSWIVRLVKVRLHLCACIAG